MNLSRREILFVVVILALVAILMWYINKYKQSQISYSYDAQNEKDCYILPTTSDPTVFGPKYWGAFHDLTHRIPCEGCRGFAEKFMVFFHDIVNLKLSKKLYDENNFNDMSELVMKIKMSNNTWPQ